MKAYVLLQQDCRGRVTDDCLAVGSLKFIFINGRIVSSDLEFYEKLERFWPRNKPFPVTYLASPGGNLNAALGIGRILHEHQGVVISGNPLTKEDPRSCSSACTFIAAGAVERHMSHLGLHGAAIVRKNNSLESGGVFLQGLVENYLDEMGMKPEMKHIISITPFYTMVNLTYDESKPPQDQLIVRLGFHMPYTGSVPDSHFPIAPPQRPVAEGVELRFIVQNGDLNALPELIKYDLSDGNGHKSDFADAIKWLEFGADQGDAFAIHALADAYAKGNYVLKNTQYALTLYQDAAEHGFPEAENDLGLAYFGGEGVEKNPSMAVFWITQAAIQGYVPAYGSLCEMYIAGNVFARNDVDAYKWCALAMDQLPNGQARTRATDFLKTLTARMSDKELSMASQLALRIKLSKLAQNEKDIWHR